MYEKQKQLQLKLEAKKFVHRRIVYHWLSVLESLDTLRIEYDIESLCYVSEEAYPFYVDEIRALKHGLIDTDKILIGEEKRMNEFFTRYPSRDVLKYVMNIPLLSGNSDLTDLFHRANQLLSFKEEYVFLISPDWSPVLRIHWKKMMEIGVFDFCETPCTLIFTDSRYQKILFKSIEDEWRYSV